MEAETHPPAWQTLLAFAIIYFVWGSTFFAIRVGVSEFPPFFFCAMRFLAAGSLVFLPAECSHVLLTMRERFGDKLYGRYGFADAFQPKAGWYGEDVIGIDVGIGMLMAENARTQFVWNTFMRNHEVGVALEKAGFRSLYGPAPAFADQSPQRPIPG